MLYVFTGLSSFAENSERLYSTSYTLLQTNQGADEYRDLSQQQILINEDLLESPPSDHAIWIHYMVG
jgi:hypothetical protein